MIFKIKFIILLLFLSKIFYYKIKINDLINFQIKIGIIYKVE